MSQAELEYNDPVMLIIGVWYCIPHLLLALMVNSLL